MKKIIWLMAVLAAMSLMKQSVSAATPLGFSYTAIEVKAVIGIACQEVQHGEFPNPLIVDTQTVNDQTFSPSADELVKCSNGVIFAVKVSSANGTALDQNCTSSGVSGMKLKSVSWPADTVAYSFMCAGDTDGTGHFTGAGHVTAKSLGISIKVAMADAQAAIAHEDYSDTVTLTISY